ncbi:hypothetical protein EUGRSUZ_L01526, partial [Eucalyptus grandis]
AYYGPAVPPKQHSYLRPSRSGGCGCGCGFCLLKLIFNIVLTVVITIGLLALLFWLIFPPNLVKFHVTDTELTQFNFTATNTLSYNLTIRNPNCHIGIYYDRIEVQALYGGQRLASDYLTPFYQGHKNTTMLSAAFQGQQLVVLGTSEQSDFNSEKATGVYDIDMKLYLRVRFKLGKIKTLRIKPRVKCGLKVPLSLSASATATFQTEKCNIDWRIFR